VKIWTILRRNAASNLGAGTVGGLHAKLLLLLWDSREHHSRKRLRHTTKCRLLLLLLLYLWVASCQQRLGSLIG
jgi:hypothetical protein